MAKMKTLNRDIISCLSRAECEDLLGFVRRQDYNECTLDELREAVREDVIDGFISMSEVKDVVR